MSKKINRILALLLVLPFMFMLGGCKKNKNIEKPKSYTISYVLNGGTNNENNPTTYNASSGNVSLYEPTKDNYDFLGWYLDANFSKSISQLTSAINSSVTLYARWNPTYFNVNYELDGGTNNEKNPTEYTIEIDDILLKDASKDGYTFGGWFNSLNFEKRVYQIASGTTGDLTFYAKWNPISYDIVYNLNEGINNEENPAKYTIEDEIILLNPEREGYDFDGWYLEENFSTKVEKIEKGSMENKTFYAKWKPTIYSVNYELNGGTNNDNNPKYFTIESETLALLDASKVGYEFKGWYLDSGFNTKVTEILAGSTSSKKFYAYFTPKNFLISFDYDGATANNDVVSISVTYDAKIGNLPVPEKTDFEFIGWWYNNILYTSETIYKIDDNISLVATWRAVDVPVEKFTVSFDSKGGSAINDLEDIEFGSKVNKPENPIKNGYKFDGWKYNGQLWDFENHLVTSNITLEATWKLEEYEIIYVLNDGTNNENNPTSYTILSDTIIFEKATRDGFSFRGWFSEEGFLNQVEIIEAGSTGNVTLYAKWAEIETGAYSTVSLKFNLPSCVSHLYSDYERQIQVYSYFTLPSFNGIINNYFEGFYYLDDGNSEVQITKNVVEITSTKDLDIYAKWNEEGINNYYYTDLLEIVLDNNSTFVYVKSYSGIASTVVIPKLYNVAGVDYPVSAISAHCFNGNKNVKNLIINADNISVGDYAFSSSAIINIDYSKIVSIGNYAFEKTALTDVVFGSKLISIGNYAYSDCVNLTNVDFSLTLEELTTIPSYCFYNCTNLKTIKSNSNIKSIARNAFDGCDGLENIEFLKSMNSELTLNNYVFSNCDMLTDVTIPANVKNLGANIFNNCKNLVSLKLYKFYYTSSITNFDYYFEGASIKNVEILENYETTIPVMYFYNNENIVSFNMGNYISSIGSDAFKYCSNLETVVLSSNLSLNGFNINVFDGTKWLENLSEILVIENTLLYIPSNENLTDVVIEEGVKSIASNACYNNKNILSLHIASSVEFIGENAFYGCSNLASLTFGENSNLTTISNKAFYNCLKISLIDLSNCNKLNFIGSYTFFKCGYSNNNYFDLTLPETLSSIGDATFAYVRINKFIINNEYYVSDEKGILYEIDENGEKVTLVSYPSAIEDVEFILPKTITKVSSYAVSGSNLVYVYVICNVTFGKYAFDEFWGNVLVYNATVSKDANDSTKVYNIIELNTSLYTLELNDDAENIESYNITITGEVNNGYYCIYENDNVILIYIKNNNVTYKKFITDIVALI